MRTESGRKTATSSIGHTSAISTACSEIQEPACHPGFMKSCRMAEEVAESGFHWAITPNQDGMVDGFTKTFERKLIGQTRICTVATDSGPRARSPKKIPTQSKAKRSSNSSPTAASAADIPAC